MAMVVPILCYPRSGVTFLRHGIEQMYGLPTFTRYEVGKTEISGLFPGERSHLNDSMANKTVFLKTHEGIDARRNGPAIHLVRDGRDVLCSHAQYDMRWGIAKAMPNAPYEHVLEQLIRGTWPRGQHMLDDDGDCWDWSRHTREAVGRDGPTATIRFEDLIAGPVAVVRAAVAELGLSLPEVGGGHIQDFAELHERNPAFFPKGKVGRWQEDMPERLQGIFWKRHGEAMEAANYTRELVTA
jgi:hypothetical protein